jgi:pathogenesis-related protein 1
VKFASIFLIVVVFETGAQSLQQEMTQAHNALRARLGAPPLRWSDELAQEARRWANLLIARNDFRNELNSHHGQNLFEITGGAAKPSEVVSAWASEVKYYDRATNTCSARCGHYTQLIWRDTQLVGCAEARNSRREVWVCDYSPPGNIVGERP